MTATLRAVRVAESNPDAREEIAATARCRQQSYLLPLDVIFFKISDLLLMSVAMSFAEHRLLAWQAAQRYKSRSTKSLTALIRAAKRFPAPKTN